jgi:hypothetical protein
MVRYDDLLCVFIYQKQRLWDNPLKFYNLRRLQLFILITYTDVDKFLYSFSFLRATPFIEELEIHVSDN